MKHKAVIACGGFAFGTGQSIFFVRNRMQEDWKIFAHWFKSSIKHKLRGGTNHNPIMVFDRQAQQFITQTAAYGINFHGPIIDSIVHSSPL